MVKPFTMKHGPYLQEQAAFSADLIISTAPELQKHFIRQGFQNSCLVPNAANYSLFSQTKFVDVHPRLAHIKGKVIGYFGNIERRCNFKLLQGVLNELQDWQLIMAGPVERQYVPEQFFNDCRIHFTGAFPQEEAPLVIKRFDVAIIPFHCDVAGKSIYPLKLYEYLAAGKPVVSTNFNPEVLGQLKETVYLGDTASDFANAVLLAYATDSKEKIRGRQSLASHHTWEHRGKVFGRLIERELDPRDIAPQPLPKSAFTKPPSFKERIKGNPTLKKIILSLIFRPKPNVSRVRWYIWLFLIFPKYFRRGVNWGARLDLSPFNKFKLGKYSRIEQGVVINNGMGDVFIHDEVHTGIGCIIIGPVTLHKHVGLSQYVRILGMHHGIDVRTPHHHQQSARAPVILEEDAFIGTGTVIMGKKNGEPLVLGRYCRVGANSVVTTDIPPYTVAVGNPAKVVRVWDFENNCWVKPPDSTKNSPHGIASPKVRERLEDIDLSRIPTPKPDKAA
jgi:acetyltransferase-like isoleucine patch superfamily enzyme